MFKPKHLNILLIKHLYHSWGHSGGLAVFAVGLRGLRGYGFDSLYLLFNYWSVLAQNTKQWCEIMDPAVLPEVIPG